MGPRGAEVSADSPPIEAYRKGGRRDRARGSSPTPHSKCAKRPASASVRPTPGMLGPTPTPVPCGGRGVTGRLQDERRDDQAKTLEPDRGHGSPARLPGRSRIACARRSPNERCFGDRPVLIDQPCRLHARQSLTSCPDREERTGVRFEKERVYGYSGGEGAARQRPLAPAIAPIRGSRR